jgi:hypothetical protein
MDCGFLGYDVTDVLQEIITSIFRVEVHTEDGDDSFFQNINNLLQKYTVS